MPKLKSEPEYTPNNSFMTSQVKVPKPFGSDYEDPLETLKAKQRNDNDLKSKLGLGIVGIVGVVGLVLDFRSLSFRCLAFRVSSGSS